MAGQNIIRVPMVYNGISQQPPHVRFSTQVEDASNVLFSVFSGMNKRSGSLFIANMTGSGGTAMLADGDYRMHPISRDETEQYLVCYGRGSSGGTIIRVLGLGNGTAPSLGIEATVTISSDAQAYLDSGSPTSDDIRMVTIADYTLIVNTKVATGSETTPTYVVTTTYADWDAMIAAGLGVGDNGKYYKCTADTATQPKGYFKYVHAATTLTEKYVRVAAPTQVQGRLDKKKMPIKLVRTAASSGVGVPATFTLDTITWTDRLSGDEDTNPLPSIISRLGKLSDIAYYRDRLVLASDENMVFSQAGDLFNFFLDDASNIVDSDPIDRALSSDEVTKIDYMVPFRGSLSIFTKAGRQFELAAGDTLTPTNASITQTTNFLTLRVRPKIAEQAMYFAGRQKSAASVYEYFYDDTTLSLTAGDVTAHVPTLLPLELRDIATAPNDRMLFALPTGKSYLFAYSWFWSGAKKDQSAWTRFDFDPDYVIGGIAVIKSNVYMLVEVDGQFVIERFGIGPEPIGAEATGNDAIDLGVSEEGSGWNPANCLCNDADGCCNTRGDGHVDDCAADLYTSLANIPDTLCPCHSGATYVVIHEGSGTFDNGTDVIESTYDVDISGEFNGTKTDCGWTFTGDLDSDLTPTGGTTGPPQNYSSDTNPWDVGIFPFNTGGTGDNSVVSVLINTCNVLKMRHDYTSANGKVTGYHEWTATFSYTTGSCAAVELTSEQALEHLNEYFGDFM